MDKSNKKPTVTIGIPAYNEEENIGFLLEEIFNQERGDFVLEKVIVSSDGSMDDTVSIAEKMRGKLSMEVFDNKDRRGVAAGMNQIMENCSSDVLVVLNADISIKGNDFIEKIIQPIVCGEAELVSCRLEALEASNFIEKMLKANFEFKENLFGEYKQGKNIFTCHGAVRAFSKKIYQDLHFFKGVGEDAYSYLYCVQRGLSYAYVRDTSVFIRLPKNFSDHKRQSLRFAESQKLFFKDFGYKFVQQQYFLPKKLLIQKLPGYFSKNLILAGAFLLQNLYLKILHFFSKKQNNNFQIWEISASSKNLIDKNNKKSLLLILSEQIFLRRIVYGFLSLIDGFFLAREKAIVLCYHGIGNSDSYFDVSIEAFKNQIEWLLKKNYNFVSISEFLIWKEKGAKKTKKPMCVLTFDDGFRSILKIKKFLVERSILPTIFVLSSKEHVSRKELGTNHDLLSWDEIVELKKSGWEIGSHGATHGDFEKMNEEALRAEISDSKKVLEEKLGFQVDYFAYPKGFYSKDIIRQVKDSGYKAAFSMDDGSVDRCASNYALPRIGINKTHLMSEFGMTFSSSVIVFRYWVKKSFSLRKIFFKKMNLKQTFVYYLRKYRAWLMKTIKSRKRYVLFSAPKRSLEPISNCYGFDRGTPIDRFYIEKFLDECREDIKGVCLEITDDAYTRKFGGNKVTKSDVLDIDTNNRKASMHGDLRRLDMIESNVYDCIIATHTFGVIDEFQEAISECHRILKPGGTLIATVSSLGVAAQLELSYWRFTTTSVKYVFGKFFLSEKIKVQSFGNVLSGQAFWVGLAMQELSQEELEYNDPRYSIVVGIRANK